MGYTSACEGLDEGYIIYGGTGTVVVTVEGEDEECCGVKAGQCDRLFVVVFVN